MSLTTVVKTAKCRQNCQVITTDVVKTALGH